MSFDYGLGTVTATTLEKRANVSAFRKFVRFSLVFFFFLFLLPIDVWEGLRLVIVALPGLFSYMFLVYRFRKIVGKSNFSEQLRKLINRYKRIDYSLDIMRQTVCQVITQIIVDGYASLFNCTGGSGLKLNDGLFVKL